MPPTNRRRFLSQSLATASAISLTGHAFGQDTADRPTEKKPTPHWPICVFTKPLNSMSFDDMAAKLAEAGFDGVEATVRKGGNVEPENVVEQLPEMHKAMKKHGMAITLITTDIGAIDDPYCDDVLRTAADLGIERFRMRYGKYVRNRPIPVQLDAWKSQYAALAKRCQAVGIQGLYQNHAGDRYMGSALWDLDRVLGDISPDQIGVVYDIRHAQVEGGMSWPTTWRMIEPRVRMIYVKDYDWVDGKVVNVPLGEGRVSETFFEQLRTSDFKGPISLHEEYLDHRDPDLVPQHLAAMTADLQVLRGRMGL